MGSLKTLVYAGAMATVAAVSARAADMPRHQPFIAPPAPAVINEMSGWYLRGDIGIGVQNGNRWQYQGAPTPGLMVQSTTFETPTVFGVGVGYQVNSWLRFDLTAQYRSRVGIRVQDKFSNTYTPGAGLNCFGGVPGAGVVYSSCLNDGGNLLNGNLSSFVTMFNGYVDLGTWHGITPYVGVGVGMARLNMGGVSDTGFARTSGTFTAGGAGPFQDGGPYSATSGSARARSRTNFAWAAHAGVSYDVTQNFKVDLGYTYLNLGEATSGGFSCFGGCPAVWGRIRNVDSHDFKLGFRYMLGGASYAAEQAPGPLIRKF